MNRVEFMNQLKNLLWDIPEGEREEALNYYEDYFDDAGVENEAQIIASLGSPEKVAAIIKVGLKEDAKEQGEYSETGYTGYGNTEKSEVVHYEGHEKKKFFDRFKDMGSGGLMILLLIVIFALPILGRIGIGVASTLIGLLAGGAAIIFSLCIAGIALLVVGASMFAAALGCLAVMPAVGVFLLGASFVIIGIGILLMILGIWIVTKVVPPLIRWIVKTVRGIFYKKEA